jgi:hypothetical protein
LVLLALLSLQAPQSALLELASVQQVLPTRHRPMQ